LFGGLIVGKTTVREVYSFLKSLAPLEMAMETDNVGFLVGTSDTPVNKILLALDITTNVAQEALDIGAELIVSHHPLYYSIGKITDEDVTGKIIIQMLSGGLSAICMHTNLDAAQGGVNDALATAAGLVPRDGRFEPFCDEKRLPSGEIVSLGRVGTLDKACKMEDYLIRLKKELKTNGIRYYDAGRDVYKVAVVGGSSGSEWENVVKSGADTFVVGEVKYKHYLLAQEHGINIIEGDHFCTENLVMPIVAQKLRDNFSNLEIMVSKVHNQIIKFF